MATPNRRAAAAFAAGLAVAAVIAFGVAALLLNIHTRKEEEKDPYLKLVRVGEDTTDPAPWGTNFPRQFDSYQRTAEATHTIFGGSDGAPARSRLEKDPWLVRMFAGYAFSIDYRDRRGHASRFPVIVLPRARVERRRSIPQRRFRGRLA